MFMDLDNSTIEGSSIMCSLITETGNENENTTTNAVSELNLKSYPTTYTTMMDTSFSSHDALGSIFLTDTNAGLITNHITGNEIYIQENECENNKNKPVMNYNVENTSLDANPNSEIDSAIMQYRKKYALILTEGKKEMYKCAGVKLPEDQVIKNIDNQLAKTFENLCVHVLKDQCKLVLRTMKNAVGILKETVESKKNTLAILKQNFEVVNSLSQNIDVLSREILNTGDLLLNKENLKTSPLLMDEVHDQMNKSYLVIENSRELSNSVVHSHKKLEVSLKSNQQLLEKMEKVLAEIEKFLTEDEIPSLQAIYRLNLAIATNVEK